MTWYTLRYDQIETFKNSWPCHGLPETLHSLSAEFDSNGNLVDLEAYGEAGEWMDTRDFDGPALLALVDDAQKFGFEPYLSR